VKERGKGAEEFCAIATMSDTDRHRQTQREIALGSTPTHRETNKTTTQSTPSHGGPREGEKGTWDQCTTDTIGGGLGFSYLFFSFFFLVCCLCPAPSLPLCLVLSFFLCWIASFLHSFLPFFLRRRKIIVLPLFLHFRWHQEHTCSNTICN
jgi:hypothetical protein